MDLNKFVEVLYNNSGKLEGQRINEKWFIKHGYISEWQYFVENKIVDSKTLYMFINNVSEKCSTYNCNNARRFIGFRDGFKQYCESCARTTNNWMKNGKEIDVQLSEIVSFVKDNNGKYSSSKIKLLSNKSVNNLKTKNSHLVNASISEHLFNFEHGLIALPKCKSCGKEHNNYKFSNNGYSEYCKGKCSQNNNVESRTLSLRKHFYKKYNDNVNSTEDYNIEMFSESDYLNNQRIVKYTHNKCGHKYEYDINYQGHTKCPKCFPIRSKTQYFIYDWLKDFTDCSFNNRQFIAPLELDILTNTFALEYDSLTFHSFGKSTHYPLNNISENKKVHLHKTDLCEKNGIQLFRIFSNEWVKNEKIWKSVILSKLGKTQRIYARKCTIKEIDYVTANSFIEDNHLQGNAKQSVRLGLYYNEELVSVMTFGKSRYNKNIEYELIRFCSKLNTTIVGGASKLLKYFEINYKPKSIISYANRRWSQGNLYEKLGFTFKHNTDPNYFYFKGNDSSDLKSRVQFQKHKLKDKLEQFDASLTETENMFNNGYRKIYDCGNKVYIKLY